jgi:hypothetical protein
MGLQTRQPQERHQFGGKAKNSQWFLEGSVNSPRSRRSIRILNLLSTFSTDPNDTAHSVSLRQFLQAQAYKSLETFRRDDIR